MTDEPWLDELRRLLTDADLVTAIRRDDAGGLTCAIDRLAPGETARAYFLAHGHELAGDLALARTELAKVLTAVRGAARPTAVGVWVELRDHVLRARLGDLTRDAAQGRRLAELAYAGAAARDDATLIAHAATARGLLLLASPDGGVDKRELLATLAILEDACVRADGELAPIVGWARAEATERFAPLYLTTLRTLFRAQARGDLPSGAARAWSWFRALRLRSDLGLGDPTLATVPVGTLAIELLALPDDRVRICLTDAEASVSGEYELPVATISRLQFVLGERLRQLAEQRAAARVTIAALCAWTLEGAAAWSAHLLATPIAWSDQRRGTLAERLAATRPTRLCVLPHGPTCMAPWSLLRVGDGPPWLDCWGITVASSWRRAPADAGGERRPELLARRLPLGGHPWQPSGEVDGLIAAMAGHDRTWLVGHGTFVPPTHGVSSLLTLGPRGALRLELPALVSTGLALRARGARISPAVWLSICEAGEVSRRSYLTERVTLAHAFLLAGAATVVAPKWSSTNLSESSLARDLRSDGDLAGVLRRRFRASYPRWHACRAIDQIDPILTRCEVEGAPPLCDLGAFDAHGYVDLDPFDKDAP